MIFKIELKAWTFETRFRSLDDQYKVQIQNYKSNERPSSEFQRKCCVDNNLRLGKGRTFRQIERVSQ
jgi:hypothetical protein